MDILEQLKEPFKPSEIHWRIGKKSKKGDKATALAYINSRDVMKRLDDVLGFDGWFDEYTTEPPRSVRKFCKKTEQYYYEQVCGRVICKLSIKIGDKWISKCDGAGETSVEGEKGAISSAFKRAAAKVGVGRYLYYLDSRFYPIDEYDNFKQTPPLPVWAHPKIKHKNNESTGYLVEYGSLVRKFFDEIYNIKSCIQNSFSQFGSLGVDDACSRFPEVEALVDCWFSIDKESREKLLRLAPTKGGIFTTEERQVISDNPEIFADPITAEEFERRQ